MKNKEVRRRHLEEQRQRYTQHIIVRYRRQKLLLILLSAFAIGLCAYMLIFTEYKEPGAVGVDNGDTFVFEVEE